jgi:transcription initiation factor IIE alpha subunit
VRIRLWKVFNAQGYNVRYSNVTEELFVPKPEDLVLAQLKESKTGLTLNEIAEKTGQTPKKVFRALRKLYEAELIDCEEHKYTARNR